MKKILWLSDSPATCTGYATITKDVLNGISNTYDCCCLAHNFVGREVLPPINFKDGTELKFSLLGNGFVRYGMDIISNEIKSRQIDIFGILLDTFMMLEKPSGINFLNVDTSPAKTFFYFPSDGGMFPAGCEDILRKVTLPISMSKFGRDQVKKLFNIDAEYIPHGYDNKIYYQMSKEDKLKIKKVWGLQNKFVVGVVARNQSRKMLDRTLKAFALWCREKPDAVLLLHLDPNDPAQAFNIVTTINRYRLNNRVIMTGTSMFRPFGYDKMNEVYNLMDVFLLSTSGEGFGIPIIEAMACGVPQVVTDYTTTKELVIDDIQTGLSVLLCGEIEECPYPHTTEILNGTITGGWEVERGIMDIYDCVKKLDILYLQPKILEEFSNNSIEKAKNYTWNKIIPEWFRVLKKLEDM